MHAATDGSGRQAALVGMQVAAGVAAMAAAGVLMLWYRRPEPVNLQICNSEDAAQTVAAWRGHPQCRAAATDAWAAAALGTCSDLHLAASAKEEVAALAGPYSVPNMPESLPPPQLWGRSVARDSARSVASGCVDGQGSPDSPLKPRRPRWAFIHRKVSPADLAPHACAGSGEAPGEATLKPLSFSQWLGSRAQDSVSWDCGRQESPRPQRADHPLPSQQQQQPEQQNKLQHLQRRDDLRQDSRQKDTKEQKAARQQELQQRLRQRWLCREHSAFLPASELPFPDGTGNKCSLLRTQPCSIASRSRSVPTAGLSTNSGIRDSPHSSERRRRLSLQADPVVPNLRCSSTGGGNLRPPRPTDPSSISGSKGDSDSEAELAACTGVFGTGSWQVPDGCAVSSRSWHLHGSTAGEVGSDGLGRSNSDFATASLSAAFAVAADAHALRMESLAAPFSEIWLAMDNMATSDGGGKAVSEVSPEGAEGCGVSRVQSLHSDVSAFTNDAVSGGGSGGRMRHSCFIGLSAGGFHGGGWGSSGSLGSLASSCGSGSRAGEDGVSGGLCAFGCTTGACAEAPTPVPRLRPPDRAAILGIV